MHPHALPTSSKISGLERNVDIIYNLRCAMNRVPALRSNLFTSSKALEIVRLALLSTNRIVIITVYTKIEAATKALIIVVGSVIDIQDALGFYGRYSKHLENKIMFYFP